MKGLVSTIAIRPQYDGFVEDGQVLGSDTGRIHVARPPTLETRSLLCRIPALLKKAAGLAAEKLVGADENQIYSNGGR